MIFFKKQDRLILLFHRVFPQRDPLWDPVDPELFKRSLKFVTDNFNVVTLEEILFEKDTRSAKPMAAITFDDGYRDFIDYSIPIMDAFKVKASMFIVSDCIDHKTPTWTYVLDYHFNTTAKLSWQGFDTSVLPEKFRKTDWANSEERVTYGKAIKQYLKWIAADKREAIIASIHRSFNDVECPDDKMMSWEDIRQVHQAGFSIGSHSVTHSTLATISSEDEIRNELTRSAKRIEEKTGIRPEIFSYPINSYDERVKRLTQEAGYKAGLAVNQKLYDPVKFDMYEIPRIELNNESWLRTKMRMNGAITYVKQLYRR